MIKAFLKGYFVCLREGIKRKKIVYNKTGVQNNCILKETKLDLK